MEISKLPRAPCNSKRERTANLYKMTGSIIAGDASISREKEDTTRHWHMRLGCISKRGLQVLHKRNALSGTEHCKLDLRKFCIMSRQCRVAFSTSQHKTRGLLDLIHTDEWEPSPVASIEGVRYYVTFIADFSKRVWVYFLK